MNRTLGKVLACVAFLVATVATSQAAKPGGGGPAKFSQCNLPAPAPSSGFNCNILITLTRQGNLTVEVNPNLNYFPPDGPGFIDVGQLIGFQNDSTATTVYSLSIKVKPFTHVNLSGVCEWFAGTRPNHQPPTKLNAPNVRIVNIPYGPSEQFHPYYLSLLAPPYAPNTTSPWATSCDVVFDGGVPAKGSSYFSLNGLSPSFVWWDVTRKNPDVIPYVSFQRAIAKNQTATATVTLNPSPAPAGVTVTLNLAPSTGTGAAVFTSTNTSTMTITESPPGPVGIKGTEASSTETNIKLSASVNSDERSKTNFSVVWVKLTQVGVGGTSQHTLMKTGADNWENDLYGSEGDTTITNPVWVDSNADGVPEKNEPVALTRGSTPVLTATLEVMPTLSLPINATLKAETVPGSPRSFIFVPRDIDLGSSPMAVPGFTTADTVGTAVDQVEPFLRWSISIAGSPFSEFGLSGHKMFVTYGIPSGYYANPGVTARRLEEAVAAAQGAQNLVSIASQTSNAVLEDVQFALQNNKSDDPAVGNYWEILDQPRIGYDCITLTVLTTKYLRIIGVPATEAYAYATGGNPLGDTDTGDIETKVDGQSVAQLSYYDAPSYPPPPGVTGANLFEAYFWLDDASVRKGFTVAPPQGPLLDTNLPVAGDKLRYNVIKTTLESIRIGQGIPFGRQYWFYPDGIHYDTEIPFPGIDFPIP